MLQMPYYKANIFSLPRIVLYKWSCLTLDTLQNLAKNKVFSQSFYFKL